MTGQLRRAEAVTSPWAAGPGGAPGAAGDGPELVISLGPGHPSGHGLLGCGWCWTATGS